MKWPSPPVSRLHASSPLFSIILSMHDSKLLTSPHTPLTPHNFILLLKCVTLLQGLSFPYRSSKFLSSIQNPRQGEFPGGLVVRIRSSHCCNPGSIHGWETEIPLKTQSKINFSEYHPSPLKEWRGSSCVPFCVSTVLRSFIVSPSLPSNFMFLESRNPGLEGCLLLGKHKHLMSWLSLKLLYSGTSLGAQWLRISLPMQGTQVRALVREDPTCHRATKPVRHNYWACALEPTSHTTETRGPTACALQQEKPPQWEACAPQRRVAPARLN